MIAEEIRGRRKYVVHEASPGERKEVEGELREITNGESHRGPEVPL